MIPGKELLVCAYGVAARNRGLEHHSVFNEAVIGLDVRIDQSGLAGAERGIVPEHESYLDPYAETETAIGHGICGSDGEIAGNPLDGAVVVEHLGAQAKACKTVLHGKAETEVCLAVDLFQGGIGGIIQMLRDEVAERRPNGSGNTGIAAISTVT